MSDFIQRLSKTLFWDVDRETIDEEKHRRFIIERVITRGDFNDWRLMRDRYTLPLVFEEAKQMRCLDKVTLSFLSNLSGIRKEEFRCFALKQSNPVAWPL